MSKFIWRGLAAAGCLGLGAIGAAQAQTAVNLIANPGFTMPAPTPAQPNPPPTGFSGELNNIGGTCPLTIEQLDIRYAVVSEPGSAAPVLEVTATNLSNATSNPPSGCQAGFRLFMPVVANNPLPVTEGAYLQAEHGGSFKLSLNYEVLSGASTLSQGAMGFSELNSAGQLSFESRLISGRELSAPGYVGYTYALVANAGSDSAGYRPFFYCQSIAPGQTLKLRFKTPVLTYTAPNASKATVSALPNPQLRAAPGQVLKLSVPVLPPASNTSGGYTSQVLLVDPFGQVLPANTFQHPAAYMGTGSLLPATDSWAITLPASLAEGRYTVRYKLGGALVAGDGAAVALGGTAVDIGELMVERSGGMYIGQHFHRLPYSGVDAARIVASGQKLTLNANPNKAGYQYTRSLNNELASNIELWWPAAGPLTDSGLTTYFDPWADYHAGLASVAAPEKRLLLDFVTPARWNSACTNNCDANYAWAFYTPKDLKAHLAGVYKVIQRYKSRVFAVECWNEPDSGFLANPALSASARDQLADVCKGVYMATKAVDPTIPVICPQPAHTDNLKYWLLAQTSAKEPITQFCDVVGTHSYGFAGTDAGGQPFLRNTGRSVQHEAGDLRDQVAYFRKVLADLGLNKPLMVTEAGFPDFVHPIGQSQDAAWASGVAFSKRSAADRAEVIYQTLASARELGLAGYTLYSFDGGAEQPGGGDPVSDVPYGLLGMSDPNANPATTAARIAAAVKDVGAYTSGRAPLLPYVSVQVDKAAVSLAQGNAVNFAVQVSNNTLLPLNDVVLTWTNVGTMVTLGTVQGATCKTPLFSATTTCTLGLGLLRPGDHRQVLVPTALKPNSTQTSNLNKGAILTASLSVSGQASVPTAPASYDPTSLVAPKLGTATVMSAAKASNVSVSK